MSTYRPAVDQIRAKQADDEQRRRLTRLKQSLARRFNRLLRNWKEEE